MVSLRPDQTHKITRARAARRLVHGLISHEAADCLWLFIDCLEYCLCIVSTALGSRHKNIQARPLGTWGSLGSINWGAGSTLALLACSRRSDSGGETPIIHSPLFALRASFRVASPLSERLEQAIGGFHQKEMFCSNYSFVAFFITELLPN